MYEAIGFLGLWVKRVTYVIDRHGFIRHAYASMLPRRHIEEAINALERLAKF